MHNCAKHLSIVRRRLNIDYQPEVLPSEETLATCELAALIRRKKVDAKKNSDLSDTIFFRSFANTPTVENLKMSPIDYWAHLEEKEPDLYRIVCAVNCAAPTQVSVERSFSSYSFIYAPQRTRLGNKRLENTFLVRMNKSLLPKTKINL